MSNCPSFPTLVPRGEAVVARSSAVAAVPAAWAPPPYVLAAMDGGSAGTDLG
jgi:hypothetical protein